MIKATIMFSVVSASQLVTGIMGAATPCLGKPTSTFRMSCCHPLWRWGGQRRGSPHGVLLPGICANSSAFTYLAALTHLIASSHDSTKRRSISQSSRHRSPIWAPAAVSGGGASSLMHTPCRLLPPHMAVGHRRSVAQPQRGMLSANPSQDEEDMWRLSLCFPLFGAKHYFEWHFERPSNYNYIYIYIYCFFSNSFFHIRTQKIKKKLKLKY